MYLSRLETEKERLWSQRLAAKVRSADGGGSKDEARKVVIQ